MGWNRIPPGKEFESDVAYAMHTAHQKIQTPYLRKTSDDTHKDQFEGTDIVWTNIRIDATLAFDTSKKNDTMPYIYHTDIQLSTGYFLDIGIRIGNISNKDTKREKYNNFPEPVVVIGTTMDAREYKNFHSNIIPECLKANMQKILYAIGDAYYDYVTKDPEERQLLESQPLQKNPHYQQNCRDHRNDIKREFVQLNYIQDHKNDGPSFS